MSRTDLPLPGLITERCRELGLSRRELVARSGALEKAETLLRGLPNALNLPPDAVQSAIDATVRQITAEADAAWRASFKPAAYLLGTSKVPSQIFFFGLTGGAERWLKIPLNLSQPAVTYTEQALAVVRKTPTVNYFGPTTGFVVNYTPDHAVRFDLDGQPVETLSRAYTPGEVTLCLRNRTFSPGALGMAAWTIVKLKSNAKLDGEAPSS